MTITCDNMTQFVNVIRQLVEHGLTFEADADAGVITLTGGY